MFQALVQKHTPHSRGVNPEAIVRRTLSDCFFRSTYTASSASVCPQKIARALANQR